MDPWVVAVLIAVCVLLFGLVFISCIISHVLRSLREERAKDMEELQSSIHSTTPAPRDLEEFQRRLQAEQQLTDEALMMQQHGKVDEGTIWGNDAALMRSMGSSRDSYNHQRRSSLEAAVDIGPPQQFRKIGGAVVEAPQVGNDDVFGFDGEEYTVWFKCFLVSSSLTGVNQENAQLVTLEQARQRQHHHRAGR